MKANENLYQLVWDELREWSYLYDASSESGFLMELTADYRDSLDYSSIAKIIDSDDPEVEFYNLLDEQYSDCIADEYDEFASKIIDHLAEKLNADPNDEDFRDEISDLVREILLITAPYKHYLSREIKVNIVMDTGDANYEYTINVPEAAGIHEKSGIAWLASTQGYDRDALFKVWKGEKTESRFLRSMYEEMINYTSSTPCVTFLVKMSLEQLLQLNRLIKMQDRNGVIYDATKKPDCGSFHIGKETMTGLFDIIDGGGSIFEIELEKDIDIPIRFIRSATPDINNCAGIQWCVGNVYGMCDNAWRDTAGEITEPA